MTRRMDRRGQITIFMVLGLVIVFAFGFVLYISLQLNHAKEVEQANSEVPPPVVFYLESLLEDAVRAAVIETIGPQGGYQDPSRAANREPTEFYGRHIEMNFQAEPVRYLDVNQADFVLLSLCSSNHFHRGRNLIFCSIPNHRTCSAPS